MFLKNMNLNATLKRYLLSSLTTFLGSFCTVVGLQLSAGLPTQLTATFFYSILAVAIRAGIKAVVEGLASTHADVTV